MAWKFGGPGREPKWEPEAILLGFILGLLAVLAATVILRQ